ncbi:MAG: OmpH family outer membrane protein [Acidobacteriota bacterium]
MPKRDAKIVLFMSVVLAALRFQGEAQQAPRMAAIDLQKTFEQSAEGKNVVSQLRQKEQAILGELDKFDKQILSLETKLKTQKLTLTEEAQQKLAFDLDAARIQRKRVEEDSTKDFQRLQFSLVSRLRNDVMSVVQSFAKENQISLVLDLSAPGSVLYCEPTLDITSEMIKRYDASKLNKK